MITLPDIYVSTDIETDGWQVGKNSMLSFGSVALFEDKFIIDKFSANLECLPEGVADEKAIDWWQEKSQAWQACRENCQPPATAMKKYHDWLSALPGRIIFVGHPLVFDFAFIDYYLRRFVGNNPFGFDAIDIRSVALGYLGGTFQGASPHHFPKAWFENLPHTHIAIEDALEQGIAFCNLLGEAKRKRSKRK